MTDHVAVAERVAAESQHEDWVLPMSLDSPGQVLPSRLRWTERGPLRGFFDGLLFDRDELARSVNRCKPDCSDADLVLHAYEREGEAVFSRLRGSFVVAIVDAARKIAIIARDPLGSHPLFYAKVGSRVLFASSPLPLLEQPGVSRSLNRAALADHLCQRWPDPHETFFDAVRRVPPTWKAVLSTKGLRVERYWNPLPEDRPVRLLTAEETGRFDEIFERAVDRCLRHGPTGIFLSGGLDSISVAAVATDRARRVGYDPPWALSIDFPDPSCSEGMRQAAVARELGLRQHLVGFHEALGGRPLFEQVLAFNRESAAPIVHTYQPAYSALAMRARLEGVRTILDGQGGDESLGVSPLLAADLIRRGAFVELARFFGSLQRSYPLPSLKMARNVLWKFGLRPLIGLALHRLVPQSHKAGRVRRTLAGDPSWVAPDQELRAEQRRRAETGLTPSDPPHGFYEREARISLDHTLVSWQEEERFEMGKRLGVHFLHPFLDPDVVDVCFRSLPSVMSKGGRSKGLVRPTVSRRFPGLGLERQRKVTAVPFYNSLLVDEEASLVETGGDFPALSGLGIVDGRLTREFVRAEFKQRGPRLSRVVSIINAEMWVRSRAH